MARRNNDAELVKAFRAGDINAFEELIQRYSAKAYSLASRLTRNLEDAEEVLQDVFITVYRKIDGFEGKSSFSSWLYRITVNAAFMKLRRRKGDNVTHLEDLQNSSKTKVYELESDLQSGDELVLRKNITRALEEALTELPSDYRGVFMLRDVDGLTSKEVSKILNITIPAVKSRLHRSRMMVRRRLMQFYREFLTGTKSSDRMAGNS